MRTFRGFLFMLSVTAGLLVSCSSAEVETDSQSAADQSTDLDADTTDSNATESEPMADDDADPATELEAGPGGYGFDRSDPEAGIANIMAAFATDEATATCIYEAWGDVANVPPAELTPELMTFEICDTSIFQLMTGDGRFTGTDG